MGIMSSNTPQQPIDSKESDRRPVVYTPPDSTIMTAKENEVSTIRMALRLALGSVVLGRDELKQRFQQKQSQMDRYYVPQVMVEPGESPNDRARYALEGALVETVEALGGGAKTVGNLTNRVFNLASRLVSPVANSRIMRPVNRQFNRFEARGSQVVQGWINTGRTEEYLSRTLVEETTTEIIEETLDYMAVSPELDQLVEAQSQEIAGEVVGEIQERTNRIFIFGGLFRRNQTK
jgi:hypothetical protein